MTSSAVERVYSLPLDRKNVGNRVKCKGKGQSDDSSTAPL
jgi:hypothetical protein